MTDAPPGTLCRDCGIRPPPAARRCPACGSPRILRHAELHRLSIAHVDCDAFYASVEKRDRPELAHRAVIVGGGRRGVVAAACYVSRLSGVRSAMPMFKALELCPDAVVIRPDMTKYAAVSRQIRALMLALTPKVQPLSLDEAFLDLSGTEALHGRSPAESCALLARQVEQECGVGLSVGLAPNKFLAKIASDLDKPRGFAVIGAAEAEAFLAPKPVGILPGVGRVMQERLGGEGVRTVGDLRRLREDDLVRRYGRFGHRLHAFARGLDHRAVDPNEETVSVSAETTFFEDIATAEALKREVWPLCETVARRLKKHDLAGGTIVLKLKTAGFRQLTRNRALREPTQLADVIFAVASSLIDRTATGERYRLIGVGCTDLVEGKLADPPDLLDPMPERRRAVDAAIDQLRSKLGQDAVVRGRSLVRRPR
jgi:DNA polymerase-4